MLATEPPPSAGKPTLLSASGVAGQIDRSIRDTGLTKYSPLAAIRKSLFAAWRNDSFDLVIVDEWHRGSAEENSALWSVFDHWGSTLVSLVGRRRMPAPHTRRH